MYVRVNNIVTRIIIYYCINILQLVLTYIDLYGSTLFDFHCVFFQNTSDESKQTFQIGTIKPFFAGRALVSHRGNYVHQHHASRP